LSCGAQFCTPVFFGKGCSEGCAPPLWCSFFSSAGCFFFLSVLLKRISRSPLAHPLPHVPLSAQNRQPYTLPSILMNYVSLPQPSLFWTYFLAQSDPPSLLGQFFMVAPLSRSLRSITSHLAHQSLLSLLLEKMVHYILFLEGLFSAASFDPYAFFGPGPQMPLPRALGPRKFAILLFGNFFPPPLVLFSPLRFC